MLRVLIVDDQTHVLDAMELLFELTIVSGPTMVASSR